MADIFSPEKRSEIMSRIRSSGTQPEERLFEIIQLIIGKRRKIKRHVTNLPGQPDFLIPSLKLIIFLDGCFYHGCPLHGHIPKSNREYWGPKLERNVKRDNSSRRKLRSMGYFVWRFWEHELKGRAIEKTYSKLKNRFQKKLK